MKTSFKKFYYSIISLLFLIWPQISWAVDPRTGLKNASPEDINKYKLPVIVGIFIKVFISLLGVIFLCLLIYGGYLWGTAMGDPGKVKKGKDVIIASIIGLLITMAAYAITYFIFNNIITEFAPA